jgi:nifR3 family TIM-barrel protein
MKWSFGGIDVQGQVVLGPMAGVTTKAFRTFMKSFGIALCYTEMVSDMGLLKDNQTTMRYLDIDAHEHPIGVQLFGSTQETLVDALKKLQDMKDDYDFIDINLGCPVPKVTSTGAGSAWLKRPEELFAMLSALVKASRKPITAKIRIGWDEQSINVREVAKGIEATGVSLLSVHSRTTKQMYTGSAQHDQVLNLGQDLKIPLIISGDIFTIDDAVNAMEKTKATAVLVARGGIGHPHFIKQLNHYLHTQERLPNLGVEVQADYLEQLAVKLVALKGEDIGIRELRGIGTHFLSGYPFMNQFKSKLTASNTLVEVQAIASAIRQHIAVQPI